ncbi:MAG: T9SS type A sorting domain-containing protein [Saprospiraceae bacterium]|nr:T9SS type A sorting domain-containing protein [Saprospiraceae bacterium]
MRKIYPLILLFLMSIVGLQAQVVIQDGDLVGGQTYNWTKNNVYQLDGLVFLEAGGVLNIEAGTVIKGLETPTNGDNTTALIITRDAKINAIGTASEPIIFTSELDDLSGSLTADDSGLWGGLVILGRGVIARPTGEDQVEGISTMEPRARYGGMDNDDDSGTLRYVSIRHGGAELAPGNEINGLTLGGVGRGTEIDYVEVFANSDDGIEWFGGAVECKHLLVAFPGDDGMDWDFGWRGKGQYWFVILGTEVGNNAGEHDGASPDGQAPFSNPIIYNATYIGSGLNANADNEFALLLRDNTGGTYANSIFTSFKEKAISVEDLPTASGVDSYGNLLNGDLNLKSNVWWEFGAGNTLADIVDTYAAGDDPTSTEVISHLVANGNQLSNPSLGGISRIPNNMLDPRLSAGSPALNPGVAAADPFFDAVNYHGAFDNKNNWALGWTAMDLYGYFGDLATPTTGGDLVIKDGDLLGGQTYFWTKENTYFIDGLVFLEEGSCLYIEAGTVIKGLETPSNGDNTSALIITRGACIEAVGTPAEPIVFTSEFDDLAGSLTGNDSGLWGGIVILGYGQIARPTGEDQVEGISTMEPRARYGGMDDDDDSGTLRYVSIRHGGAELAPGNEINGLTLGGVGRGTEIDYVEVFANSDDGIEWFGGAVECKHLVVAFPGDDGMDWDFGWRGKGQFWFVLLGSEVGNNAGEHDGASPDGQAPFSKPTIYNATYIGSGLNANADNEFALMLRDNTGGTYANSIFTSFKEKAISVEDLPAASGVDSYGNLLAGDLVIQNNYWWEFGAGNTLDAVVDKYANGDDPTAAGVIAHLSNNGNKLENPFVCGVSRNPDGQLNPRLAAGSAAADGAPTATDIFYDKVTYHGAFGNDNWAAGWTALELYGYFNENCETTGTEEFVAEKNGYILQSNWPNPASAQTTVSFTLPTADQISLKVYDLQGRLVATPMSAENLLAGTYSHEVAVSHLANGTYYITLETPQVRLSRKMTVIK